MTETLQPLAGAIAESTVWELCAVLLAVLYLLLAIRQNIACWAAAIASASIYAFLMFRVGLYMESVLQLFYIGVAFYGWYHWSSYAEQNGDLPVESWPLAFHVAPLGFIVFMTAVSGSLLARFTDAAFPYIDSFTTWAAIIATWMVARKVLQNWHYWFVIDAISACLYIARGLFLTALLFLFYLVLIVFGLRAWRNSYEHSQHIARSRVST